MDGCDTKWKKQVFTIKPMRSAAGEKTGRQQSYCRGSKNKAETPFLPRRTLSLQACSFLCTETLPVLLQRLPALAHLLLVNRVQGQLLSDPVVTVEHIPGGSTGSSVIFWWGLCLSLSQLKCDCLLPERFHQSSFSLHNSHKNTTKKHNCAQVESRPVYNIWYWKQKQTSIKFK